MPEQTPTWREVIQKEAEFAGIPPALAFAIVDQESSGNPSAVGQEVPGQGRAQGFFQLMPATAQGLGVDPANPYQNIRGGVALLKQLHGQYGNDVPAIIAAYHGGTDLTQHGPKTEQYVKDVLARLQGGEQKSPGDPTTPVSSAAAPSTPETFLQGYPKTQGAVRLGLKALPVAGGIAGGILGGPVGAGLLAGAGEGLRRASESAAGFAPPSTLAEQAEGAALAGGSTAALGAAGKFVPGAAVRMLKTPAGRMAAGAAGGGLLGYHETGGPIGTAAGALGGAGLAAGGNTGALSRMLPARYRALYEMLMQQAEKKAAAGAAGASEAATGTEVATQTSPLADVLMQRATQPGVEIPRNLVLSPEEFQRLDQLRQAMKPVGSTIGAAYQRFGQGGVR